MNEIAYKDASTNNTGDGVYEWLLDRILTGVFEPGSRLREEEIAEALSTSRTPVREALRRLGAEGTVERKTNRSAVVPTLRPTDILEVYDIRVLMEGLAARRAAEKITPDQLQSMKQLCEEIESLAKSKSAASLAQISKMNMELHRSIYLAADSPRLANVLAGVFRIAIMNNTFSHYSDEEMTRSLHHHRELLAAFEAKDSYWAESTMHSHLRAAQVTLHRAFGDDQTESAKVWEAE